MKTHLESIGSTGGFFLECGGYDGEYLSNTLFMERSMNWTGLLVEADRKAYRQLSTRNRKAFLAPVCLSTNPYPMKFGKLISPWFNNWQIFESAQSVRF
ncbi:hypothetical protein OUZ56_011918 [Daphnia magna]|uniref:Uncharacterized protein n=1 Tax=Daphnia magna TaxID=35525 RepID=A0ABQ9Z2U0_9CRUS|nr:hypothetical protein OUZ56_011918 [Daphnia magna]